MIRARILIPTLVPVLLAAPAAAQERADAVPRELATVLVNHGPAPDMEILVGRAPEDFPTGVIPAGARVLGALVGGRPYARMLVIALPQREEEAAAAVAAAITGAGWTRVTDQAAGFVSHQAPHQRQGFCQGDRIIVALTGPRPEGGTHVRLGYVPESNGELTPCNPATPRTLSDTTAFSVRPDMVPTLYPPPDAEPKYPHTMWATGRQEVGLRMTTALAPSALAAHYARQLEAAGWTPSAPLSDDVSATQMFRRRDPDGRELHGALVVIAVGETTTRDLIFRVSRLPPALN